jgi:hypothetical protein
MTEQPTLEQTVQRITNALGELLQLQAGPAFPGKTHKVAADTAILARLWTAYRNRQFEVEFADELADTAAHQDELDEQNGLRRGEA